LSVVSLANTVGYVLYSLPLKHDIQIYADLLYAVDIAVGLTLSETVILVD